MRQGNQAVVIMDQAAAVVVDQAAAVVVEVQQEVYDEAITMVYAAALHADVYSHFTQKVGKDDFPIFSHVYDNFLEYLQKQSCMTYHKITEVLNVKLYDWYYGNCISDFIVAIFMPRLYQAEESTVIYMTKRQVHDAYRTLYRLIHFYNVSTTTIDYYGETYHNTIAQLHLRDTYIDLPDYIKEAVPQFHCLLKYGPNLILIQEAFMKKFILKKQKERRIKAYSLIADWWFDIVNSPYTKPGKRLLLKRASRFNSLVAGGC
jgi:hypothetical protein